jgi:hypothetical protein
MQVETAPEVFQAIAKEKKAGQAQNSPGNGQPLFHYHDSENSPVRPKYQYAVEGYQYFREELNVKYQNQDGDFLELTYTSENLNAFSAAAATENGPDKEFFARMLEDLNQFILTQERRILEVFFGDNEYFTIVNGVPEEEVDPAEELGIPEYWNAENTSQRIVDFATSFFEVSGKDAEEFGRIIIGAVKRGFEEANEILGNLPGAVGRLIAQTQSLTLEKLDAWVEQNTQEETAVMA